MQKLNYTTLLVLLPIVFIVANIFLILNIDKNFVYTKFDLKYRDINPILKDVGIEKYITSGGTCVTFETVNNITFERRYVGIVQMLICHFYYNDLIERREKRIGFFIDTKKESDLKIPFISLGRSDKKDTWYYLDIYSYIKNKYSVVFLISYIIVFCLLLSICVNLRLVEKQKKIWIIAIILPILYMLV